MNKKGIVRIMEVMLAITLLTGVVLYVYANQQPEPVSADDYMYNYQKEILNRVTGSPTLRSFIYQGNQGAEQTIESDVRSIVPANIDFSIRICKLSEKSCNLENDLFSEIYEREIYVLDTIVASDGASHDESGVSVENTHMKVRVFMWERFPGDPTP